MSLKPTTAKGTIICIPGLGGHPSVFNGYEKLLPDYQLIPVGLINQDKTLSDLESIAQKNRGLVFLCSCYGLNLALRIAAKMPRAVNSIIVIEPFFVEFQPWMKLLIPLNKFLIWAAQATDKIGLRRKRFWTSVDYSKLGIYPIFIQPIFDILSQNLTDYFVKGLDILTFKLPQRVETKTLFVLSPKGFIRSEKIEQKLKGIFIKGDIVKIPRNGHNIITNSQALVANQIKEWLAKNHKI